MKKLKINKLNIIIIIAILMMMSAVLLPIELIAGQKFVLKVDGTKHDFNGDFGMPLLSTTGRTFVPIRFISEVLGYEVDWSEDTWFNGEQKVWIKEGKKSIEVNIGESQAIVNGIKVYIDYDENDEPVAKTKPFIHNDRTYLPLRFISTAFGAKVEYQRILGVHNITILTGKEESSVCPPGQTPNPLPNDKDLPEPIIENPLTKEPVEDVKKPVECIDPNDVNFPKPEFEVSQRTHVGGDRDYFNIKLLNYRDYDNANIKVSTKVISPERLNSWRRTNPFVAGEKATLNFENVYGNWNYIKLRNESGVIYRLGTMTYAYNIHNDEFISLPKEGEIIKLKTTITVNGETAEYFFDVPFRNKDFSFEDGNTRRSDR